MKRDFLSALCALFLFPNVLSPSLAPAQNGGADSLQPAYREQIITPHWVQRRAHEAGPVEALFLVNDLARREPDELALRFDVRARTVRTLRGSNAYKNVFDLDSLVAGLKENPDVFVVSASKPWNDLGPKGCELTADWVKTGGRLVVFTRGSVEKELEALLEESPDLGEARNLTEELSEGLDLEWILPGKLRDTFEVTRIAVGEGAVVFASPFDRAYVGFNAFFPKLMEWDDPDAARETGYLLAHRIIRYAAGKLGANADITANPTDGGVRVSGDLSGPNSQLQLRLYSAFGQLLVEASAERTPVEIPAPVRGKTVLLWEVLDRKSGARSGIGTDSVDLDPPMALEVADLLAPHPRNQPITIEWTVPEAVRGSDDVRVEAEIYDADRNQLRFASVPATAGRLTIPAWQTRQVSHLVRILLTGPDDRPRASADGVSRLKVHIRDGRRLLAEQFQWLQIEADAEADSHQWTVLTWGDERGNLAELWRGHRLRELGLNAMATIGSKESANRWASASGLRLIPTNVFVPENRYNKGRFDEAKTTARFAEFAKEIGVFSPVGYSFADEPPKEVILPWLEKGSAVLDSADPNARFGYCGVWPGPYSPELMRKSGYLGLYSPGHLYNLNVWLGIERDIYRSFRSPDGIVTCWTHYAPWADHEPYSRTVPWLWLFDGMDGVGYFKSAGMMFGILDGDLRSTHETRWWSEEVRELNAGIAEQVKRMTRHVGSVRLLFGGDLKAVEPWARALNEHSVPYQFLDVNQLGSANLEGVRLLVAVDGGDLGSECGEVIEQYLSNGGMLVAGGGLASLQDASAAGRFERFFGFATSSMTEDASSSFAGIRSAVDAPGAADVLLEGLTTGECLPAAAEPGCGKPWHTIGGVEVGADSASIPERLATIAGSGGVRVGSGGKAIYLALRPDSDSIKRWLPSLLGQAVIESPSVRLLSKETNEIEERVYVSRFGDGVAQMVGLMPDYIRIPPSQQVREIAPNPLDSEDSVQKQQQNYFRHGPQRWEPVETRLMLGQKTHLYDVRRGEYRGKVSDRSLSIQPGRPELFALLPYGPPELKLETPKHAGAGEDVDYCVRLALSEADGSQSLTAHVIRASIVDGAGRTVANAAANLHTVDGVVEGRFSLPHGLKAGNYLLQTRDILTGVRAEAAISIGAPEEVASAPLPPLEFRVERIPTDWPEGKWEPIPEDDGASVAATVPATAKVKALSRKVIRYGNYNGKLHLMTDFTLENGLRRYDLKYLVCCDPKVFDPGPPQQVRGLNGSGLGIRKPRAHLWYYNSYLKIFLGEEEMVLGYELAKIEDLSDDTTARVRLEWLTPTATVRLDYAMIPGHEGLFHRLSIQPNDGQAVSEARVNLYSYPAGFGKGGEPFFDVAQENQEWLLMGDAVRDRDFYESGQGSAGLLILPEEWSEVKYGARPLLQAKRPEAEEAHVWRLHWVTWIFPERGNAAAREYMRTNSDMTEERLKEVFR